MTYRPGAHIYLAAPFFNDIQTGLCDFIEGFETNAQPIYSPRKDGGVLKPDSTNSERLEVFVSNTMSMSTAQWMLAVIDDFDTGVLWEMGYAHAKAIPTLGYSDVEGRGLNVMLAGSCDLGFVSGRSELETVLQRTQAHPNIWEAFPRNTWRGEIQ